MPDTSHSRPVERLTVQAVAPTRRSEQARRLSSEPDARRVSSSSVSLVERERRWIDHDPPSHRT
jgi:hypothetical protein